ncbi:mucin-5AC-like [Daphnia carinata]|uniref:mucin-5AC-like n=1 Tax=Daphnia carinata TaxID=120202 RepID=UPI00257CA3F0|nr:mucin-5AC-like [Daphnia carinata]
MTRFRNCPVFIQQPPKPFIKQLYVLTKSGQSGISSFHLEMSWMFNMLLLIIKKAVHHPFSVLLIVYAVISLTSADAEVKKKSFKHLFCKFQNSVELTSNVTNRMNLGSIGSRVHNTADLPHFKLSIGNYDENLNPSTNHYRPIRFRPVRVRPIKSPRPVSWNEYDACGGNILVPLSNDRNILIEQTYKSTDFPSGRTHPLVCSWKVEVSNTNCNRGLVTMTVDELSRLSDEEGCLNGYYRVSPFMKEAKICGRIGTVPPFQWHVDDQQTENVTINLKHIGLNDGDSEGMSFTLTGECLPNEVNVTIDGSRMNSNGYWVAKNPEDYGVPTVVLSADEPNDSQLLLDTRELKEDPPESLATTTLSSLDVKLGFSMDYYRNRKSTGPQISETPTTPSPTPTARPPSQMKSTSLTTRVTKRPSNGNPSTTIRPPTRRPSTPTKRPVTTSKRPTTRSPIKKNSITKSPVTKRPVSRHPPAATKTPAIRVPTTTIRPAIKRPPTNSPAPNHHSEIPWLILKSPQPEHEFSSSVIYSQQLVDHAPVNKITPVTLSSKGEIPWLILKTPHHNQLLSKVDPIVLPATTKSPHTKIPTKSVAKIPPKNPTKISAKTPSKTPSKTVKTPTKSTTRTPYTITTRSPSRNPTRNPTRSPTKKPVTNPAKIQTKTSIKNSAETKIPTKDSSRNPLKNASKSSTKNSAKSPTKSSAKSPTKNSAKSPTKNSAKSPTKSPTKSSAKSPITSASRNPPSETSPINNPPAQDLSDTKTKCPSAFNLSTAIHPFTRRPSVRILPPSWDQYDTCGGTINVPLSFDRLSSYESSQFPAGRNFPLICTWTIKVRTTNCSRGRITLRVDGRSRLADVKGCTKGYFSVYPFLMQAKICGRIGIAAPLHWYVEDQQSEEVTIVMENIGLDDGRSEGFSFSLQGECITNKPDKAKLDVDVENFWSHNRWMNRLSEDFRTGDGPRVIAPGVFASTITQEIETDDTHVSLDSIEYDDYSDVTEATTLQHSITSKPWTVVYPEDTTSPAEPEQLYTTVRPSTTTSSYHEIPSTTAPQVTRRSTTTTKQPTTRTQPTTTKQPTTRTAITKRPITSTTSTEIPWLILQSPDPDYASIARPKSTTKYPVVVHPTTKRPTVPHPQTTPPVVTRRPTTQHPVTRFPSTNGRPTITTRSPPTTTRPVSTTSIPWLILKSSFLNQTNHSSTGSKNTTNTAQPLKRPSTEPNVVKPPIGFYNTEWHTDSSSTYVPTLNGGQLRVDTCQGNIVVPMTSDPKSHKEFVTLKSTWFPFNRITPLICSWNVKASKNCHRGIITMTIDERSRLADDVECLRGYYRVAPFMNDSKICGRVHTVPAFQWYVDHSQPEDVSIILKHVGLNDGYSEGLSFTLSGECLPEKSDLTKSKAIHSYKDWLQQLASQSRNLGVPTVIVPDVYSTSASGSSLSDAYPEAKTDPEDFSNTSLAKQSPETSPITAAKSPDHILSLSSFYANISSADGIHFPDASNDDLEDLWLILQSPSSRQSLPIPSEDESNNVSLEVSKTPNIPVDDMFDDALSYITRLLNETKKISNPLKKRQ